MCMCSYATGKNNINGEYGYCWNDASKISTRPVHAPELEAGDEMLADEPGRCGRGIDAHCHHYRLVKKHSSYYLLVQHGGGLERIRLSAYHADTVASLLALSSEDRYWLLFVIGHAHTEGAREASEAANSIWRKAAAEKRIKTRKHRGGVKVWIDSAVLAAVGAGAKG